MLYGASRQSRLLAADLRAGDRLAADRVRVGGAAAAGARRRGGGPAAAGRSLIAILRQHVRRPSAAQAGAR